MLVTSTSIPDAGPQQPMPLSIQLATYNRHASIAVQLMRRGSGLECVKTLHEHDAPK